MDDPTINASCQTIKEVPFMQGFHFCTKGGHYTGISAVSLYDFTEKLKTIDKAAIDFHVRRHDFQTWIRDIFGDDELAWEMDRITNSERNLRQHLVDTINSHINVVSIR